MKIRCVVEHITYQNPDNGYSVVKVKVKDYSDLVTLVGNLLDVVVGSVLPVECISPMWAMYDTIICLNLGEHYILSDVECVFLNKLHPL